MKEPLSFDKIPYMTAFSDNLLFLGVDVHLFLEVNGAKQALFAQIAIFRYILQYKNIHFLVDEH